LIHQAPGQNALILLILLNSIAFDGKNPVCSVNEQFDEFYVIKKKLHRK
jgi:hypothetical protein